MGLEKIINKNLICLHSNPKTSKQAIEQLAKLLFKEGFIDSYDEFVESVLYRESISSTYSGLNVAIPHGICSAVKMPCIAFMRTESFNWEEEDKETSVNFIFLIGVPKSEKDENNDEHLEMLSKIAMLSIEDDVRQKWMDVQTEEEFLETLRTN